jgi:hypothetical protein
MAFHPSVQYNVSLTCRGLLRLFFFTPMPPMPPYAPYYTCVTSHEIHEYGNMKVTMAEPSQRVSQGHLFPSHLHQQYQQYSDSVYKRMAAKSTVPNRSKLRKKKRLLRTRNGLASWIRESQVYRCLSKMYIVMGKKQEIANVT